MLNKNVENLSKKSTAGVFIITINAETVFHLGILTDFGIASPINIKERQIHGLHRQYLATELQYKM